jgi:hypothetical protein
MQTTCMPPRCPPGDEIVWNEGMAKVDPSCLSATSSVRRDI